MITTPRGGGVMITITVTTKDWCWGELHPLSLITLTFVVKKLNGIQLTKIS